MRYVALLRGINVGGNNKVEMGRLRLLFENLGMTEVTTYINSGNVVFSSPAIVTSLLLEEAMKTEFGFEIKVLVVEAATIARVSREVPTDWINDSQTVKCDVLFLWPEMDNPLVMNKIATTEVDELRYIPGAVVWRVWRKDYKRSGMNTFIGSEVYRKMTGRNINTVRALAGLL